MGPEAASKYPKHWAMPESEVVWLVVSVRKLINDKPRINTQPEKKPTATDQNMASCGTNNKPSEPTAVKPARLKEIMRWSFNRASMGIKAMAATAAATWNMPCSTPANSASTPRSMSMLGIQAYIM